MSTRAIGLDIGTFGVRAVQLGFAKGQPTLERFAQVALPPGAMHDGEVVDGAAVTAALRRLWHEAGFKSRDVVVGVANQRVLVRQVELPAMSHAELTAALPFEAQELIPIPVEDAVLDFQILEEVGGSDDGRQVRLLLAAAHRDMVTGLLSAVAAAGLKPVSVDVAPLAMVRALAGRPGQLHPAVGDAEAGTDAIVGIGAGVTTVVVHEAGVPRFMRVIPIGGDEVTAAIAKDLGVDVEVAENLKRRADVASTFATVARAGQVVCDRLGPLGQEIRESLEFYSAQSQASPVARVVLTGGGSTIPGLLAELRSQLDASVELAHPLLGMETDGAGFTRAELAAMEPLLAVPIGLALARQKTAGPRPINLVPRDVGGKQKVQRQTQKAGMAVAGLAGVLAVAFVVRGFELQAAQNRAERTEARTRSLQKQEASMSEIAALLTSVSQRESQVRAAVTDEVAWTTLLRSVSAALPADVNLTSFNANSASPRTVTMAATGVDQSSTARWLLGVEQVPSLGGPWVTSSTASAAVGGKVVNVTGDATLTDEARSERARQAAGGKP